MKITSSAFKENEMIPSEFTCEGQDQSPPLGWENAPANTKSFALIMEDPDAPSGTFVHWVLYNLPADVDALVQNVLDSKVLPNGARQGVNDFGKTGYGGPCPPSGTHRYFFKLYALDEALDLEEGARKEELLEATEGHLLAEAKLMGKYRKGQAKHKAA